MVSPRPSTQPLAGFASPLKVMAIPIFGFIWTEKIACLILVMVGLGGLLVALTGHASELGALHIHLLPPWLPLSSSPFWLGVQSLLIMGGGIGAWALYFFLVGLTGVLAALFFLTSIGMVSFLTACGCCSCLNSAGGPSFPNAMGGFPTEIDESQMNGFQGRQLTRRWTGARIASFSTCSVRRRMNVIAAPGQLNRYRAANQR
jgi:hypothetical protein